MCFATARTFQVLGEAGNPYSFMGRLLRDWDSCLSAAGRLLRVFIFVVAANPGHRPRQRILITALWCHVEDVVGADEDVETAGIGGVGVEDFAALVLVKRA